MTLKTSYRITSGYQYQLLDNNELSELAVQKINEIIRNSNPAYSDVSDIDQAVICRNSKELTAKELFVEYKSALTTNERAIFDDYVVSSLEKKGLIKSKLVNYEKNNVDLTGLLTETTLTGVFDTYVQYTPTNLNTAHSEIVLNLQDLYVQFEDVLAEDVVFIRHYANAIALSNTSEYNNSDQKPYKHLIISALFNGNYLVMPNPAY